MPLQFGMAGINRHEDLKAWQLSDQLEDRIYAFLERPGPRGDPDFCSDIRRSARSAPANLCEGFYRFRPRDNAKFVRYALGSLGESKNHLRHALKRGYISEEEYNEMWRLAKRAFGASTRWLQYLLRCPPDGPPHGKP